jgi:hypothetical protein
MLQRAAPRLPQGQAVAGDFGGAADPDAVAQARDRYLEGLVHHRRFRRAVGIDHRDCDRVALDRVDRNPDPDLAQHQRRVAAQR